MRVSFKRFIVFVYLFICASLSLINYRYSSHQYEIFATEPDYELLTDNNTQNARSAGHFSFLNAGLFTKFMLADMRTTHTLPAITESPNISVQVPLYPEDSKKTDRILEQMNYVPDKLKSGGPVVIRISHTFGGWGLMPGDEEFQRSNCLVKNCLLIDNDPGGTADAFIFKQQITETVRSNPNQIWIFYILESPEYSTNYGQYKNLINWTASYRWDSDIVAPYERFVPKNLVPKDQMPIKWPKVDPNKNYAKGKTKQVIWFVSHCVTNNRREKYVAEIAKHIHVDTYGVCGTRQCPRGSSRCDEMMNKEYKFYFAFENSNCQDYVTEKFFVNGLQHDIIPIVMGAQKEHYSRIAPEHSFIHVDDFKSPMLLAAYLQYLDRNDTAYNEYFRWKGSGKLINTKFWCRLCAMLNNPRPKTYNDLEGWWRKNVCWPGRW